MSDASTFNLTASGFVEGPLKEVVGCGGRNPMEADVFIHYPAPPPIKVGDTISMMLPKRRPWNLRWLGSFIGAPQEKKTIMRVTEGCSVSSGLIKITSIFEETV